MILFGIILHIVIGSLATFFYKYECLKERNYDDSDDTAVAIVTGICWPVVAPLAFAILFAKKYADKE